MHRFHRQDHRRRAMEAGFSLIELMVALVVLMIACGVTIQGVLDLTRVTEVVNNRTDMHNGVRNATELLTQEVGQAGRVTLPFDVWMTAPAAVGDTTVTVNRTDGMFVGELLVLDTGTSQETIRVSQANGTTITTAAALAKAHNTANAPVAVAGGFAAGIVPNNMANGSGDFVLKIFGDINGDRQMVYIEYVCDINAGRLYRNAMPFTANAKPMPTVEQILIDNLTANPGGTACFTYQPQTIAGTTYILDVAITLSVQSQMRDVVTRQFQRETKALLNVSPRNVFNTWQQAGLGLTSRIQPIPPTVQNLLP
jgi:prepilin-type N-terminal cleavage/methylation domain-containing protein